MGVIFTFIMGLLMSFEPITDNDWFWHYVVGNFISTNKTIPNHELFTWHGDYSWISHEWLTEAIMYKLTPVGCLIIMLVIFLLLYILMAKNLRVKLNKVFDYKLLYLLLMTVFFKVCGPRPYVISLLFFAYLVYALFTYVDHEQNRKLLYSIPILQLLWVNLHGGSSSLAYIFLIGVLLCHIFLKLIRFKIPRIDNVLLSSNQFKNISLVLLLTIIATCINPFGIKMLLYPFTNMSDSNMINYILEWESPSFHGYLGLYIFIMIVAPLFNLMLYKKDMKLHELAFQLLFLYMALKSQRFVGMYGIYSTWTIGKYFFVTDNIYDTMKKPFIKYTKIIYPSFITILIVILMIVGYNQFKVINNIGIIDNDGFYSDDAVLKLIELKPGRLYNDYSQGGYLLYKLDQYNALEDIKVFSYGLGDVFSKEILPDNVKLQDLLDDPKFLLDKYDFDYLITTRNHVLHYYLEESNDYSLVYSDDMCYIFKKGL